MMRSNMVENCEFTNVPLCRVPIPPGKSWKVRDFVSKISRTLKVLENKFGPGN